VLCWPWSTGRPVPRRARGAVTARTALERNPVPSWERVVLLLLLPKPAVIAIPQS
jgi:hypothetical protein